MSFLSYQYTHYKKMFKVQSIAMLGYSFLFRNGTVVYSSKMKTRGINDKVGRAGNQKKHEIQNQHTV